MAQVRVRVISAKLLELIEHNGQLADNSDWDVLYAAMAALRKLPGSTLVEIEDKDWLFQEK